jgi:hypothetical protein
MSSGLVALMLLAMPSWFFYRELVFGKGHWIIGEVGIFFGLIVLAMFVTMWDLCFSPGRDAKTLPFEEDTSTCPSSVSIEIAARTQSLSYGAFLLLRRRNEPG